MAASSPKKAVFFDAGAKRGEIQELKEELNNANKEKKKEALKKVIQAMTNGLDVSSLFPDVVNCMQTNSLDLKKLVYLYVINYAKAQPDLAILAINGFRKDANDPHNPLLRALAVRTMGCIRLEQMTEYLLEPLRKSCADGDPYVRKTATLCVAKLFDINPQLVEEQGFIEILRDMLGDSNPMVVANAVASLCEISAVSRRNYLHLTEDSIQKLMPALGECSEWGQVFILDALAKFDPANSKVAETVLERGVVVRLAHSNSAVVLSAIGVMMKFMDRISSPELVRAFCKKMTPPLVTLLSAEAEIQYVVMRNINLIVQKQPQILQQEVRMFVCKYNDPLYVKLEKIKVMVQLANDRNVDQVISEFREYASEVDIECVRQSVRAIGQCAIKLDKAAERCVDCLLDLIRTKVSYVVQEAIVVIRDIFRKYPGKYEQIIVDLCENLEGLDEPEAKAAMIWIIGEYAERIDGGDKSSSAADLLQFFLESFHEEPSPVQQQLLTATVKLSLKLAHDRSSIELVQRVLKMATQESNNPDLRDRAYMYWRMLSKNPELAKRVVLSDRPTITEDSFACQPRVLERLVANICTLASVYHEVPESFLSNDRAVRLRDDDSDDDREDNIAQVQREMRGGGNRYVEESGDEGSSSGSDEGSSSDDEGGGATGGSQPPPPPLQAMQTVLSEATSGQQGAKGLHIDAVVMRGKAGGIGISLLVRNASPHSLTGWAVRIKENPFGISPAGPLPLGDVHPGGTSQTLLQVQATPSAVSGSAPTSPLYLEVAIKHNIDVFYMNIPYDLSAVLAEGGVVPRDVFQRTWTTVPAEQKARVRGQFGARVTPDMISGRMRQYYVNLVAQMPGQDGEIMYFSAQTVNKMTIYCELLVQASGPGVQLTSCSNAPPLVPLFQSFISELLRVKWA